MDAQTQRRLLTLAPTYDVVVAKDGSGNYTAIQEAVDAHSKNSVRLTIYIKAGVYNEQVIVPKKAKFLTFIGDGDQTVITGSKNVALMEGMTTFRSATLSYSWQLSQVRDSLAGHSKWRTPQELWVTRLCHSGGRLTKLPCTR